MRKTSICCFGAMLAMLCLIRADANAGVYKLAPVADTYTYVNTGDTNYGPDQGIASGTGPTTVYHNYYAYLKFDLTGIPATEKITSAVLHVYQYLGSAPYGTAGTNLLFLGNDDWTEIGLTWNNQPGDQLGGVLASSADTGNYVGWSSFEISLTGDWDAGTDRVLSLVLAEMQHTVQSHTWYSKDAAEPSLHPYITVTTTTTFDGDGDGMADLAVWRPESGVWYIIPSGAPDDGTSKLWGLNGDLPVPGDYDGDGRSDAAVWRPGTGVWYVVPSGDPGSYTARRWGLETDLPVAGDYDGDDRDDRAVYRPGTGTWYVLPSGDPASYTARRWGMESDLPVPGDYDGDHKTDYAVRRPGTGIWYILKSGSPDSYTATQWGTASDIPVPGDFDGDNKADIAVWRPGTGVWYIRPSGSEGYTSALWGAPGDVPLSGDYDRDGRTDIAVWRPANGTWYIQLSGTPGSYISRRWGKTGDIPLSGLTGILNSVP